ncbi:Tyrosine-protein kinase STK [Geodia barretti]|uniref:Tyrosine-protein kinase STK n=1 Tax=Geodia barretti TaxID=519541 RepID=A0AA35R1D0_GEOBA|nr:Tyrosine-protein kinase STK [Geodia barretti]
MVAALIPQLVRHPTPVLLNHLLTLALIAVPETRIKPQTLPLAAVVLVHQPRPPLPDPAPQSGSDPNNTGQVAGIVAVLLTIVVLLVVVVVVTFMCLKKKKRQRKVVVSRVGGEAEGMINLVYGATDSEKMEVSVAASAANSNTYCGKTTSDNTVPTPYIYASADTLPQGQVPDSSYAAIGAEANAGKRPSLHYEVDSIYEAPASSENGLYAQYEKIKISTIPRSTIEATECLGSGQFGTVNKGVWQSPSSPLEVAIKTLKSSAKEEDKVKFLQEGAIMGQFRHPNVVKLHGIVREQQTVLLVIELLAKEDLREHLLTLRPEEGESVNSGLPHTLLSYCRQSISGLSYLAKKGFVHRDIAARNILLSEDHETCKIADFGMSRDLADETYYISRGGKIPVKWTAPEALHYKKYSTASDVWSFGCLMYEIWSLGHKPFETHTNPEAIKMVDKGYRLAPPPGCPRAIYQLMIKTWNPTPSERPMAETLSQNLSRPDPTLLSWNVSDKPAGVPQALQLGGPLDSTPLLYPDLQRTYLPPDLTNNDYDEPS